MYVSVSVSLLLTFHFLPPAHVVCEKVMLSVVSVSQFVCLQGGSLCDHYRWYHGKTPSLQNKKSQHWPISVCSLGTLPSPYHVGTPLYRAVGSTKRPSCFLFRVVVTWVGGSNVSYYVQEKHSNVLTEESSFLKGFQSKFLLLAHSIVRSKKRKKIDDWCMASSTLLLSADICRCIKLPDIAERL